MPHQRTVWTGSAHVRSGCCSLIGAKLKGNPSANRPSHPLINVALLQPLSCVLTWTVFIVLNITEGAS